MALSDPFSNTAPTAITLGTGAAFDNGAPTSRTISRAAAFDNNSPVTGTVGLSSAFSNTGPTAGTVSNTAAFDNTGPANGSLGALTVLDTSVRVATVGNIDLTAVANGTVIDGVTLATGNIFLAKDQIFKMQNGLYYVGATGPATARAYKMDSPFRILVAEGTANTLKTFLYQPVRPYVPDVSNVVLYAQGATPTS